MKLYLFLKEKPIYVLILALFMGLIIFGVFNIINKDSLGQVKGVADYGNSNKSVNQIFSQSDVEQTPDGKIQYQKSIVNTDLDQFTITFDIITKDVIQKVEGMGASVVLVIDISESMGRTSGGRKVLDYAKDAAKVFANEFLVNASVSRQLGLVSYDDIATDQLIDPYRPNQQDSLTSDIDKYVEAIDKLETYHGQTNIQHGLNKARKILEQDQSGNPKYIVLLSDGAANRSYKADTAVPIGETVITPYQVPSGALLNMSFKLSGFDYSQPARVGYYVGSYNVNKDYYPTISEGIIAKEQYDIDVYTILFHSDALPVGEYHDAVFTMLNVASKGQYYEVNDITKLDDLFYDLEKDIVEKSNLWKVIDPMGSFITFEGFAEGSQNSGATYQRASKTIVWDLLKAPIVEEDLEAGWYRYSFSYHIRLESNNLNFLNGHAYPTNGVTTLYYFEGQTAATGQEKKAEFTVPKVVGASANSRYLHVIPLDMIAYQGGQSASSNTFPRPYFTFQYDDGTELTALDLENLSFYMDGVQHIPFQHEYFIYEYPFRAYYVNNETGEIHNDPNEEIHSENVGHYMIQLTTKDMNGHSHLITALDQDGNIYDFRFNQNANLEVRSQNLEEPTKFMEVLEESEIDRNPVQEPTAFVPNDTKFVNSAGIPLEKLYSAPDVRLMVDSIFPKAKNELMSIINQLSVTKGKSYEMIYLDLVDHADGNILVKADKPITVLYPYPRGTDKNTEFKILHFYSYNREVGTAPVYNWKEIIPVNKDTGIAFQVTEFSPFVVAYEREKCIVQFQLNGGIGKDPLSQYDKREIEAGKKIDKPQDPTRPGYTFLGWETTVNWVTHLWNFDTHTVQGDMVLVARWMTNGGGGGNQPPNNEKFDHFAYLQGYPDKTFQTAGNMTRAETAMMIARLLAEQMNVPFTYESSFMDIKPAAWYTNAVGYLQMHGIVQGYEGKYRPDNYITRAEFIVMLTSFENVKGNLPMPFKDVSKNHWAASQIALAAEKGWIEGYEDGSFKPDQFISRAEVATITNHVMHRIPDRNFIDKHKRELVSFKDLKSSFWGYYDIMETANGHDFTRNTAGEEAWTGIRK